MARLDGMGQRNRPLFGGRMIAFLHRLWASVGPWGPHVRAPTPLVFRDDLQDARQARLRAGEAYADAIRRGDTRDRHHAQLAVQRANHRLLAAELEAAA